LVAFRRIYGAGSGRRACLKQGVQADHHDGLARCVSRGAVVGPDL